MQPTLCDFGSIKRAHGTHIMSQQIEPNSSFHLSTHIQDGYIHIHQICIVGETVADKTPVYIRSDHAEYALCNLSDSKPTTSLDLCLYVKKHDDTHIHTNGNCTVLINYSTHLVSNGKRRRIVINKSRRDTGNSPTVGPTGSNPTTPIRSILRNRNMSPGVTSVEATGAKQMYNNLLLAQVNREKNVIMAGDDEKKNGNNKKLNMREIILGFWVNFQSYVIPNDIKTIVKKTVRSF